MPHSPAYQFLRRHIEKIVPRTFKSDYHVILSHHPR